MNQFLICALPCVGKLFQGKYYLNLNMNIRTKGRRVLNVLQAMKILKDQILEQISGFSVVWYHIFIQTKVFWHILKTKIISFILSTL